MAVVKNGKEKTVNANAWAELWRIAVGEPEGPATITPDDDPWTVTLTWPDGTEVALYFHHDASRWVFSEPLDAYPADVAARDAF